jgi:hypothetical protein
LKVIFANKKRSLRETFFVCAKFAYARFFEAVFRLAVFFVDFLADFFAFFFAAIVLFGSSDRTRITANVAENIF